MTIVTFIADSPNHEQPVTDEAIRAVREILEKTTSTVIPVASIQELWDKLPNAKNADLIQIVGHAAPGRLLLGRIWTGIDEDANNVYVLDSDPFRYGVLFERIAPSVEVRLLGCALGSGDDIADGPTLLFDLARMWGNKVSAPVDLVNPQDFDTTTGAFIDDPQATRLCSARNLTVTVPEKPALVGIPTELNIEKLTIKAVPILARRDTQEAVERARQAFAPRADAFAALFNREIAAKPLLLAAPEIEFESSRGPAQLIANGRILRFRMGPRLIHLVTASKDSLNVASQIVKATVAAALRA